MVKFSLVLLILLAFNFAHAKLDRITTEGYLGEKDIRQYSERYYPLIFQDLYRGTMTFEDDVFFQNYFAPYLFQKENEYSFFLKSELSGGMVCSNELLSTHFDDLRYSYRLISLSYLLEGQWHNQQISQKINLKKGCAFDLTSWLKSCQPKSKEMKQFLNKLAQYQPPYTEQLEKDYSKNDWWKEFKNKNYKFYSHYRIASECGANCSEEKLGDLFRRSCEADQNIMNLICSEEDEIFGLSQNRDAYFLLGLSNIINTYNKSGEASGCLRRFSEVMSHKEVHYEVFDRLFPAIQRFLRDRHQERFLQGRVFFYGSAKEFEDKGLTDLYVKQQPLKIGDAPAEPTVVVKETPKETPKPAVVAKVEVTPAPEVVKETVREIKKPVKSAFLLASEVRTTQNLEAVEVDMMKLKYDYVFSLDMINNLSIRLKTFMTRDALVEMMNFDKLGTKDGPVPLMFLKYMIDMEEHQGLWNIIAVLGTKFYVSNEIDEYYKPVPEYVELLNNSSTGNKWQLVILRR